MTPVPAERIKELQAHSKFHENHAHVNSREVGMEPFTWGELRFLLDTAAQAGKTCEWRQNTICKGTVNVDGFRTSCGVSNSETHPSKFCEDCGGRVIIRDGRTT